MTAIVQQIRLSQRETALEEGYDAKLDRRENRTRSSEAAEERYQGQMSAVDRAEDARETKTFWRKAFGFAHAIVNVIATAPIVTGIMPLIGVPDPNVALGILAAKGYAIGKATENTAGEMVGEKANDGAEGEAVGLRARSKLAGIAVDHLVQRTEKAAERAQESTEELGQLKRFDDELRRMEADVLRKLA